MIRAITFDAVGTLIIPYPSVGAIYAEVLKTHGGYSEPIVLDTRFGTAYKTLAQQSDKMDREFWKKVVGQTLSGFCPRENLDKCFNDLWFTFAEGHRWKLLEGVKDNLVYLKTKGYQLAVLSNNDLRLCKILEEKGIADYFDAIFVSEEIGHAKPSFEIFLHVEKYLKLRTEEILHIGDNILEDYLGAKNAGWKAMLIGRKRPTEVPEIDYCKSLTEAGHQITINKQAQATHDRRIQGPCAGGKSP